MTARLATASSSSGSHDGMKEANIPVIVMPCARDGQIVALKIYYPLETFCGGPGTSLQQGESEIYNLDRNGCLSDIYALEDDSFVLKYRRNLNQQGDDRSSICLNGATGVFMLDLPASHYIFQTALQDARATKMLILHNQGNGIHYRNATKPILALLQAAGFLSLDSPSVVSFQDARKGPK